MSSNKTSISSENEIFPSLNNVISHPSNSNLSEFDRQLYVVSCGNTSVEVADAMSNRPNGRADYHILYVKSGKIHVTYGKIPKRITLNNGEAIFLNYMEPHSYIYKALKGCSYYWLHFNGSNAQNLLNDLSLSATTKIHAKDSHMEILFNKIIQTSIKMKPFYHKKLLCSLIELLTYTSKACHTEEYSKHEANFDEIITLFHYPENASMTIDEYAQLCNLSKSRFIKNFKKETGYTPNALKTQCIIENIKWILKNTSTPISNIPIMYHFSTPSYFYTFFKKNTGMTPSQYRQSISEHG